MSAASAADADLPVSKARHRFILTKRQAEALYWLSFGWTTAEIGVSMGIAESTAKSMLRGAYQRMNVRNQAEAIRVGFETGLLVPRARTADDPGPLGMVANLQPPKGVPRCGPVGYERGRPATSENLRLSRSYRTRDPDDEHDQET